MKKLKAVFFGTPDFSVPALEALKNHPNIELSYVVTMPDRPSGRGHKLKSPEVAVYAKENKIPLFQTENINKEADFIESLEALDADIFIVLAFAQFLGSKVLNLPKSGCFNIHTSLLPKYRGAAPIQYALLNGDKTTGVSIQKMVKKMDAGDIAWSTPVEVSDDETGGQLYTRLKFQAALSLNNFIYALVDNNVKYESQDESEVSFAPTLKKEDGLVNFKERSFEQIHNQIRALFPWPGTYCYLNNKRLKVFSILKSNEVTARPGETKIQKGALYIGCKDCTVRLVDVQLEGKKRSSDTALLNGLKEEITINPE